MTTILISLAAAALGAAVGLWAQHHLAKLTYRTGDELELPQPGRRTWLNWTSAIALAGVAAWLDVTDWTLAPVLLPLTLAGPALAAIDLDVMRIPNRILGPVALATMAGLASTILTRGETATANQGLAGGLVAGGTLWLLYAITGGGVGFGDVKLASLVGATAGVVSLASAWWALLLGSASALIWAKITRRPGPFAYGPWLLLGGWVAVLTSAH